MLAEDALLLHGRRPCWDLCRYYRVGWEEGGGTVDTSILIGQEDESEVAFLASVEVALDGCHVCRQELVGLLDGGVVRLVKVLWE